MADAAQIVQLFARPLTTGDAAGLLADVEPTGFFQPTMILETDIDDAVDLSATGLTTAGDSYECTFAPDNDYPEIAWYPIAMRGQFSSGGNNMASFWETEASYTVSGVNPEIWTWDAFSLDTQRVIQNVAGNQIFMQTANPVFHGMPPRPTVCDGGSIALNQLGGFSLTVQTFSAAVLAALTFRVDARWLGFPRASIRSAGFYTPRMFFQPN